MARLPHAALHVGAVTFAILLGVSVCPGSAQADEPDVFSPRTQMLSPTPDDGRITRARELLGRARKADESATQDQKVANELSKKLDGLRQQAIAARRSADVAQPQDREDAVALAEQAEAELALSEAEIVQRRTAATDARKAARDLRDRALRVMRGEEKAAAAVPRPLGSRECRSPFGCDDIFQGRF